MKPLMIDLYCGLGGWSDGGLAEGYDVIGFDIERHQYGGHRYAGQLVIQDVLTLHGSQFKNAALIVASPPCQGYSYRAMPWKKAKALPPPCNALFDACFRIQREACEAAGKHVPLIVENVRGAQPWVGRARWNYGSFYLWGDVPALMPVTFKAKQNREVLNKDGHNVILPQVVFREGAGGKGVPHRTKGHWTNPAEPHSDDNGRKVPGFRFDGSGKSFQTASVNHHSDDNGRKIGGDWFSDPQSTCRRHGSKSKGRKMASAMIAKIPLPLSRYLAATFHPQRAAA